MQITQDQIKAVRHKLLPPRSISSLEGCLEAVERLGFLWPFTPGTDLLPSLFSALDTDDDGRRWEWAWTWKDKVSASRQAYYGKVVGGKPTLVSMAWLPYLYALTGNTGELADDLDHLAHTTKVEDLSRKICTYLEQNGPTGTRTLHAELTDGSRPMKSALEKALLQVDTAMLIVKSGAEGGNSIANVWDLFPRYLPQVVDQGTAIPTREAAVHLLRQFFTLTPGVSNKALLKIFPWSAEHQQKAIARLVEAGELKACIVDGKGGIGRADLATE